MQFLGSYIKFIRCNLRHSHFNHVRNIAHVKCIILIVSLSTKFHMPSFSGLLFIADIYNQDNLHSPHISILRFTRTLFYLNSTSNSVRDPVLNLWDMTS